MQFPEGLEDTPFINFVQLNQLMESNIDIK